MVLVFLCALLALLIPHLVSSQREMAMLLPGVLLLD